MLRMKLAYVECSRIVVSRGLQRDPKFCKSRYLHPFTECAVFAIKSHGPTGASAFFALSPEPYRPYRSLNPIDGNTPKSNWLKPHSRTPLAPGSFAKEGYPNYPNVGIMWGYKGYIGDKMYYGARNYIGMQFPPDDVKLLHHSRWPSQGQARGMRCQVVARSRMTDEVQRKTTATSSYLQE